MVEYIKGKDGKPLDLRSLSSELRDFRVNQGACSDGKNVYVIFERAKIGKWSHRCKILKLDSSLRVVKVSDELKIGHGNDVTYCDGNLYVTHSAGGRIVHRVNAITLKHEETIKVRIPKRGRGIIRAFNGIARFGHGFILRVMWGSGMVITDENFRATRYFTTPDYFTTSQGMDQKGMITYRAFSKLQSSDKNFLVTYNDDGEMLERIKLDITGELESVFFVGDELYGTVYRKTLDENGRVKRTTYLVGIL